MPTQLVFLSIVSVSWAIAQPFCDGGACRSLTQSPLLERESIAEKSVKNARARDSDIYDDDELAADVSMLQTLTNHEETTDEYTSALASDSQGTNRVAWLHIPKAGTSFGTTLAHYANASLPEEAFLHDCAGRCGFQFTQDYPIDIYFRNLMWTKRRGNWADHDAITPDAWEEFKGSFFGMFREPVSWTRSAYSHYGPEVNESLSGFVARTSATATLMLSGQRHGASCLSRLGHDPPPPPCTHPAADVTLALQRLDGFRFVGLTTDWLTSICLFHLKFGGPCNSNELTNARPTNVARPTNSGNVNISQVELENVVAESDNPDKIIYARAKAIFDADVMKYGATDARCAQLCKPNDTAAGAVRHAAEDQTAIGSAENP